MSEEEKTDVRKTLKIFEQSPSLAFLDFENINQYPLITPPPITG